MEKIKYWQEIREFKIGIKKAIIPFEKFFRLDEVDSNKTSIADRFISEIEI